MTGAPIDGPQASIPSRQGLRAFISYGRSDAQAAGRQLADALKRRFGADNVFFDTKDLALGTAWQREITKHVRQRGRRARGDRAALGGGC